MGVRARGAVPAKAPRWGATTELPAGARREPPVGSGRPAFARRPWPVRGACRERLGCSRQAPQEARDRGAAVAEFVVIFPVLFFMLMLVVQGALWYVAKSAADAAAQAAAQAGASASSSQTQAAADAAAASVLKTAGGILQGPTVTVQTTGGQNVQVHVIGTAAPILDFAPFSDIHVGAVSTFTEQQFHQSY